MYSFSRSYGELIKLFCSHDFIFDNLPEVRRQLDEIQNQSNVSSLEKLLLKSIMYKPLEEVRNHLKVMIVEVLDKTIGGLYEFSGNQMSEFKDPITHKLITDPVTLSETGRLYNRQSLMKHFESSKSDPMSGKPLKNKAMGDSPYIRNKIVEKLGELTEQTISKFTELKKFFKYFHSNIVILGHFPIKIADYDELDPTNCLTQVRRLMNMILKVLDTVSEYVDDQNLEILELRDFYAMYFYHCDPNSERVKLLQLLDVRQKIESVSRIPEERIRVLEDRILLSLPPDVITKSVRMEIYYKLLDLYKDSQKDVFRIFPSLLALMELASEKKELIKKYLSIYPESRYLKLEFIPFMSERVKKSKVYFEIAKLDFISLQESYEARLDQQIEVFLHKSIRHNISYFPAHELLLELFQNRCERCVKRDEFPSKELLNRTGKQALILADQTKPGDDITRMKYLEIAFEHIPEEPSLREDLMETYNSLGEIEKIYEMSKQATGFSPSKLKSGGSGGSGGGGGGENEPRAFRFLFELVKSQQKMLKETKRKEELMNQEISILKENDKKREAEVGLLRMQVGELLRVQTSAPAQRSSPSSRDPPSASSHRQQAVNTKESSSSSRSFDSNKKRQSSSSSYGREKKDTFTSSSSSRYDRGNESKREKPSPSSRNKGYRDEYRSSSSSSSSYRKQNDDSPDDYDREYGYDSNPSRTTTTRDSSRTEDYDNYGSRRDERSRNIVKKKNKNDDDMYNREEKLPPRPRRYERSPSPPPSEKKDVRSSKKITTTTTTTTPSKELNVEPEKKRPVVLKRKQEQSSTMGVGEYVKENLFVTTVIVDNPNRSGSSSSSLNRWQNFSPIFEAFGYSWKLEVHRAFKNLLTVNLKLLSENVKIFGVLTVLFGGKRVSSKDYDHGVIRELDNAYDSRSQWYDDEEEHLMFKHEKKRVNSKKSVKDHWIRGVSDIGFECAFTQSEDRRWTFEIQIEKIRETPLKQEEKKKVEKVVRMEKRYEQPVKKRMEENVVKKEKKRKEAQEKEEKKSYNKLLNSDLNTKKSSRYNNDDEDDEDNDILIQDDSDDSDTDFFPQPKNKLDDNSSYTPSSTTKKSQGSSRSTRDDQKKSSSYSRRKSKNPYRYSSKRNGKRSLYDEDDEFI